MQSMYVVNNCKNCEINIKTEFKIQKVLLLFRQSAEVFALFVKAVALMQEF